MAESVKIEGIQEQIKKLKSIISDDPSFRKRLNTVIGKVLKEARNQISKDARAMLGSDPRQAYKAVRNSVYKRILGGQVNILAKRKAGRPTDYKKPRQGYSKFGGNRWGRSERTIALEGYQGTDRGFVLRFWNAGTQKRAIHSYTDQQGTRHNLRTAEKGGNRGSISARNWFGTSSQKAMEKASGQLQDLIDRVIAQEFV